MTLDWDSLPSPTVADAIAIFPTLEQQHGLPAGTLAGVMQTESSGNPNVPVGKAGDTGLFQFTPGAAKDYNVDPNDPISSAVGAAKYIGNNLQKSGGDIRKALIGYNAGPGNMNKTDQSYADRVQANMPSKTLDWDSLPDAPIANSNTLDWDSLPDAPQSITNTIIGSAADVPGIKQIGAGIATGLNSLGVPGFENAPTYAAARQNQDVLKQQGEVSHPAIAATANVAANAVPYMMPGLGPVAGAALSGGVSGAEALNQGASNKEALEQTALGAALPMGLAGVSKGANIVGNVARGAGDFSTDVLKNLPKILNGVNPLANTGTNIAKNVKVTNDINDFIKQNPENMSWLKGNADHNLFEANGEPIDVLKTLQKSKNKIQQDLAKENPLVVASMTPGIGNKIGYLTQNNPLNYGGWNANGIGNFLLHEAPDLGLGMSTMPHVAGPLMGTQYGAALISKIASDPTLSAAVKAGLIKSINGQEKEQSP
jgi:hypothetical protein